LRQRRQLRERPGVLGQPARPRLFQPPRDDLLDRPLDQPAAEKLGRRVGLINPLLYANPAACNDVTGGDNKVGAAAVGYAAGGTAGGYLWSCLLAVKHAADCGADLAEEAGAQADVLDYFAAVLRDARLTAQADGPRRTVASWRACPGSEVLDYFALALAPLQRGAGVGGARRVGVSRSPGRSGRSAPRPGGPATAPGPPTGCCGRGVAEGLGTAAKPAATRHFP
jgi:hypothetical protein